MSIRDRIHPDGHIIGGLHDRGMRLRDASAGAGFGFFRRQVELGNINLEKRDGKLRYTVVRLPKISPCTPNELALLRAKHFIQSHRDTWMTEEEFRALFRGVYANLVNYFKQG